MIPLTFFQSLVPVSYTACTNNRLSNESIPCLREEKSVRVLCDRIYNAKDAK